MTPGETLYIFQLPTLWLLDNNFPAEDEKTSFFIRSAIITLNYGPFSLHASFPACSLRSKKDESDIYLGGENPPKGGVEIVDDSPVNLKL